MCNHTDSPTMVRVLSELGTIVGLTWARVYTLNPYRPGLLFVSSCELCMDFRISLKEYLGITVDV